MIAKHWWKGLCVGLLIFTFTAGFLAPVPALPILNESIRNLYFHVPMWFGMLFLLFYSVVQSLMYLSKGKQDHDLKAEQSVIVAILFGCLGLGTGMIWGNFTWGTFWPNDPKIYGATVGILIYFAYFILRGSLDDRVKKARVAAVYSIFAFVIYVVFIFIVPRMTESLHPGSGGNPGFNAYDLDNRMRVVFYPAVLGWTLLGFWFVNLRVRVAKLEEIQNRLTS